MIALSVPRSPPRLGVFIAVVLTGIGLPSHPSLTPSLRPLKQIESVVSLSLGRIVSYLELGSLPSYLFSFGVSGEVVLDLVEALPFLGFDIPGILPGEGYIGLCTLAE